MAKPTETPPATKAPSIERIIRLQMLNRRRVHEYYRSQKNAGPTRGENTMGELLFGALAACDELAEQGKEWSPL